MISRPKRKSITPYAFEGVYNIRAMRHITIHRRVGPLGGDVDVMILYDESPVGQLKAGEDTIVLPIGKTEQAIQGELKDENGRVFRSNAYFFINGKSMDLFLLVNGYHMTLTTKDPQK